MQKRRLGAGGPEVSAIGVGAMSFAGVYGQTTEAEAHALLAAALELGIDHVDTSNVYGMGLSESMIGSFPDKARLPHRHQGGDPPRPGDRAALVRQFGRRISPSELEGSLKRLGVETVDLFYVHRRDPEVPIEEVTGALAGLVEAGKTRAIGFSEIAPALAAAGGRGASGGGGAVGILARDPRCRSSGWCRPATALGTALVAFSPVGPRAAHRHPADAGAGRRLGVHVAPTRASPAPNFAANLGAHRRLPPARRRDGHQRRGARDRLAAGAQPGGDPDPRHPLGRAPAGARGRRRARRSAPADLARIEAVLPVGWAHGDRYSPAQ